MPSFSKPSSRKPKEKGMVGVAQTCSPPIALACSTMRPCNSISRTKRFEEVRSKFSVLVRRGARRSGWGSPRACKVRRSTSCLINNIPLLKACHDFNGVRNPVLRVDVCHIQFKLFWHVRGGMNRRPAGGNCPTKRLRRIFTIRPLQ